MIKRDCFWYYCEHDMGASIDGCSLSKDLYDCPCSDDCVNYISRSEAKKQIKYRIPKKVTHEATIYKCCTCPSCGNVVSSFEKWGDGYVMITVKFCKFCGQMLDWSDEIHGGR